MNANPSSIEENRRPIAARGLPVFQRLSRFLADRGVSPNGISTFGMLAGVAGGVSLAVTVLPGFAVVGFLLAPVCIGTRLLCNMLDGMVAIDSGRTSSLGEVFNELPDRVSDVATLVGAGYALGGSPTLGFVAAMLALLVAYVRSVGVNAGAGQQFGGPMAKQQRMAVVAAASLVAAFLPTLPLETDWLPSRPGTMAIALVVVVAGTALTAVLRLRRIVTSLQSADAASEESA